MNQITPLDGLVTDSFAGGGGASLGIELAIGRSPDIAINHDAAAIAMHQANHPDTLHLSENVWKVDPLDHVHGKKVALAWFSPDCKHFSKAKGGKPVARNIRDLAWVVVLWAQRVRPAVIMLENVEEFRSWGPLDENDMPCPVRKGETFRKWTAQLRKLGYKVEFRELRACDYGAPTIRKRLFMVARCDGAPIVWPEPTHGAPADPDVVSGRKQPWVPAAAIIDWSLPCHSIFLSREEGRAVGVNRPLADNTMARIAKGVFRYVIDHADPFIVTCNHGGSWQRGWSVHEPMKTITAARDAHGLVTPVFTYAQQGGAVRDPQDPMHTVTASKKDQNALIAPTLIQTGYGERAGQSPRVPGLDKPIGTIVAGGCKHALVAAFLAQHNTGVVGHHPESPVSTITQRGTQQALVAAHMLNMKGSERRMSSADSPASTVTSGGLHIAEVRAFLTKYYGTGGQWQDLREPMHTVPTRDRMGLVTVSGEVYQIADIGMRMLSPRELFRAQGFPDSYIIDPILDGKPMTKTKQIEKCGNSVVPAIARALVEANFGIASASTATRMRRSA